MILRDILSLADVMDGGDRVARRRWIVTGLLMILGDFGLVYFQILALERQGEEESYLREMAMYGIAVLIWWIAARRLWDRTGTGLAEGTRKLVDRMVERLGLLPLDRFESLGRGTIVLSLTGDAMRVANATQPLIGVPTSLVRLSLGTLLALSVSVSAAVVAVVAMCLMALMIAVQLHAMHDGFRRTSEDEVRMYDLLRGHVDGASQLKLHAPRAEAIGRTFHEVSGRMRNLRTSMFSQFFEHHHASNAILYAILGVNVFLLPLVITVENETIREINLVLVWVAFSVFGILFALPELSSAKDALHRLLALDTLLEEETQKAAKIEDGADLTRFQDLELLEVRGLRYEYPASREQLGFTTGPIDVEFRRGEVVFITGRNGSGKSTFLKMLTGLYPPQGGEWVIDGKVVPDEELIPYRQLFGTIFTDHHIFARAFGISDEDGEQAEDLLEEMQIAHKTAILEGRVTNRDLSTGQRKRLAMVLTRLQDRPILIFDEWAADQDPEFRALFYRDILPSLAEAGKFVIAVTHDDPYFDCADRLIHFEDGQIQLDRQLPPEAGR